MYSLDVLQRSVTATRHQNIHLYTSYSEHCRVFDVLMEVLTYNPHGAGGLLGQLSRIRFVPIHKLPCSNSEAAWEWYAQVCTHKQGRGLL
jgi:hypothetical protein